MHRKPRRTWPRWVTGIAVALLVFAGPAAWAAQATYAMIAGDNLTTTCAGPSLAMHRNSSTSITLKCKTPTPTATGTPSTSPTPTPSVTPTPTSTPTPTQTSTGYSCVTSAPSGNCGPYDTNKITNANGYNTYVGNNCWGDPSCKQTTSANGPDDWKTVSTEPANNGAVRTYPNVGQLMETPASGYQSDTPLASLKTLQSTYSETTPYGGGMIAQFAYDVWISNASSSQSDEIMIWTDNSGRDPEDAGATFNRTVTIAGQTWSLYYYGGLSGETIWSLGARHAAAQQASGTVDIKAMLDALVSYGYESAGLTLGQIDAGWEICSTGGVPRTFTVHNYTLTQS